MNVSRFKALDYFSTVASFRGEGLHFGFSLKEVLLVEGGIVKHQAAAPLGRITHKLSGMSFPTGPPHCLPILMLAITLQLLILYSGPANKPHARLNRKLDL